MTLTFGRTLSPFLALVVLLAACGGGGGGGGDSSVPAPLDLACGDLFTFVYSGDSDPGRLEVQLTSGPTAHSFVYSFYSDGVITELEDEGFGTSLVYSVTQDSSVSELETPYFSRFGPSGNVVWTLTWETETSGTATDSFGDTADFTYSTGNACELIAPLSFVHIATAENTSGSATRIDHPLLNGDPAAMLLVTQNLSPVEGGGVRNDHVVGVRYGTQADPTYHHIFHQNDSPVPLGASFNVRVISSLSDAFVHTADGDNILQNYTLFESGLTDSQPGALVLANHAFNPGGVGGLTYDAVIGVWYSTFRTQWSVYDQGLEAFLDGASFNVQVPGPDARNYFHVAAAGSITGDSTMLSHPDLDGNPQAIFQVTQNFNPPGGANVYNDNVIGVRYEAGLWYVFNQNGSNLPTDAAFSVSIDD